MPRFNFYNALAFSILIACFSGCKENKEELQQVYNNYRFDNAVIQKLPLYDSLVIAIQRNQHILIQDNYDKYPCLFYGHFVLLPQD